MTRQIERPDPTIGTVLCGVRHDHALADKTGGSAYRVVVSPAARKEIPLRLGLSATAEIVTTRRRIIELVVRTLRGES